MRGSFIRSVTILAAGVSAVDPLINLGYAQYQGQTLANGVNQWLGLRFAAPVTGTRRFAAPQLPLQETVVQDATKQGAICVSANNQEGLQFDSERQPMAEDCLFAAVYAPANATETSNLPIMFFIQGGGFNSNSNANFNGTGLVESSGMNMIVVQINYRVGILGFIGGTLVDADTKGAVPNNGFNDMIAAARWVKEHATKFGGNASHVVLSGDSAGANAIDILLAANNGVGFPDLFVGAAAESTGWGSEGFAVNRDNALMNNLNATGCLTAPDPIDCMRVMPIAEFQNKTTKDGWGPTIDGKFLTAVHYQMFEQGKFQNIPVIFGYASNEATPDFISNQSASTDADIENHIRSSVGKSIMDTEVAALMTAYPASLNNVTFFGRDVSATSSNNATLRKGTGAQWQRDAAILSELKLHCVGAFFSDMYAAAGQTANFAYRYNILDATPGGLVDQGLFTPHTSELYAIWGKNNTDGGDPGCFKLDATDPLSCATGQKIVQAYWISFVRTLNPNTLRLPGSPEWGAWTIDQPSRIVFDNSAASMEQMGAGVGEITVAGMNQRQRCLSLTTPLSKRINLGLGANQTLPAFANNTRIDPTLAVVQATGDMSVAAAAAGGSSVTAGSNGVVVTTTTNPDGSTTIVVSTGSSGSAVGSTTGESSSSNSSTSPSSGIGRGSAGAGSSSNSTRSGAGNAGSGTTSDAGSGAVRSGNSGTAASNGTRPAPIFTGDAVVSHGVGFIGMASVFFTLLAFFP